MVFYRPMLHTAFPFFQLAVRSRPSLQTMLIKQLVWYQDMQAAAYWAVQCAIQLEYLPMGLQMYLMNNPPR